MRRLNALEARAEVRRLRGEGGWLMLLSHDPDSQLRVNALLRAEGLDTGEVARDSFLLTDHPRRETFFGIMTVLPRGNITVRRMAEHLGSPASADAWDEERVGGDQEVIIVGSDDEGGEERARRIHKWLTKNIG